MADVCAATCAGWRSAICSWAALLHYVTGRSEQQLFLPKTACILISLLLTLLLFLLVGGGLMRNVLNYMVQLLSNVGALL